jgi:ABC-type branched-subunit amino acid transport system ATPase component/branched-subunit amino acid ABC-type transport system permease component
VTATVDRLVQRLPSARVLVALAVAAYGFAYVLPGTGDWLGRDAPIAVVVIGVVYGTVTALGAMALILTYRATRFVNFAYGAMGSLVGVLSIGLYREHGVPYWLALPIGVAGGVVLGALIDILVLRRFKDASRLVVTVASIGLAQVLGGIEVLGSKAVDFVGLTPAFDVPFDVHWDLGVKVLGGDEMLIVLVAPVVLMALAWFLLRTDHGTAVRAAAENTDRAMLLGIPVRRNTTIVWMLAGGLAALAFILKAPFTGFAPGVATTGPSVLLPALAAAVVARMESLPVALGAGIGLGIIEQVARWNTSGSPSFVDALFLVVIVLALLVPRRGRSPVREGATSSWSAVGSLRPIPEQLRRLPEVRASLAGGVALLVVLAVVVPRGWSADDQLLAAFALVWAMVGVSLVILTGWGGNISLGQFGLVGVGALVAGNLIADQNLDLIFVLVLAGAAGALVALVIGLPALRIGSLLLAVTTIAFAVALDSYVLNVNNFPELVPSNVPRPLLFGRYDLEDQYAMYVLCLVVLVVWITVAVGLRKARTGRTLMATRDNERAAAAAGVEPTRAKLGGFLLAGTIAGVAGALHVQLLHSLSPGSYPVNDSITVFSTAVIGGLGSLAGAVSGVLLFKYLETVQALGDLRLILTGTGLLVVLYALPGGLGQLLGGLRDRLFARIAARRGIDLVAPAADGTMAALGAAATAAASDEAEEEAAVAAQRHGPISADAALSCRGLDLGYGSLQVVRGFDFDVARGELVALLGTNGAGKSTVLKGISGLLPPTAGEIALHGERSTGEAADVLARRGLALVPGGHSTFPSLTVAENLRLAGWMLRHDQAQLAAKTAEVLELFPALAARIDLPAGALSGGEQQMLGLAGALITSPDVLMIDELSLGLAPTVVAELLDVVRRINEAGTTVVIVEQSVNVALELAARAVFMEKGQVRFEGPTGELLSRPDLLRSVFIEGGTGGSAPEAKRPAAARAARAAEAERATEPPELVARSIVKRYGGITAVDGVDLAVRRGEILGLIGHNGAGKTTLLDCLSGFTALDGGRIELRGVDITQLAPPARAHLGLGRSFQDARLYPSLTVAETVAVALERHVSCRSALADGLQLPASFESELVIAERVDELLELMGLLSLRHRPTGELSTGTRRIVDLACTLAQEPAVVLLDEPSSGVGQRETEALTGLLLQVKERTGCAMVVIEHDMPLLRSISDRMVALELGAVIAEGAPADVLAHPAVIASYLGTDEAVIHRSGTRARKRKPKPPAKQATAR